MKKILMLAASLMLMFATSAGAYNLEKSYDIYKAKDIVIDGKLGDWDNYSYSHLILPTEDVQVSFFESYEGPEDLSGVFWFAWSEDGLYMAAFVNDNVKHVVNGTGCWSGDSIQFAAGIDNSYGPEFGFSTEGVVYRYKTGKATMGPEDVVFAVGEEKDSIIYELFFPWGTLSSGRPSEYFPFGICMNENDGDGRKGWIETTGGIADTKRAADFWVLKLVDKDPDRSTTGAIRPEVNDITVKEDEAVQQTVIYEVKTYITYPDVKFHWARTAIDNMASRGILRGHGEFYYPALTMTRGEFLATLVRAAGLDPASYQGGFADIPVGHWCSEYIQAAVEGELLPADFYAGGLIRPDELIKREDMIALYCNALLKRKHIPLTQTELSYADSGEISVWAMPYIRCAQHYGLISGNDSNMICPQNLATRAEVAVLANRLVEMTQ
ncbi:MAG: S-layer homology domain-containing protein [Clostridia bacterium]|nr:S-layer homology domain-containing protein [Clostridia bacterium]MBP3360251.1 S-layer homology domain-containing protein [Clostridia bacterium]